LPRPNLTSLIASHDYNYQNGYEPYISEAPSAHEANTTSFGAIN